MESKSLDKDGRTGDKRNSPSEIIFRGDELSLTTYLGTREASLRSPPQTPSDTPFPVAKHRATTSRSASSSQDPAAVAVEYATQDHPSTQRVLGLWAVEALWWRSVFQPRSGGTGLDGVMSQGSRRSRVCRGEIGREWRLNGWLNVERLGAVKVHRML